MTDAQRVKFGAIPSPLRHLPEAFGLWVDAIETFEARQLQLFEESREPSKEYKADPLISAGEVRKHGGSLFEIKRTLSPKDRAYQRRRTEKIEHKKYVQKDSWFVWASWDAHMALKAMNRRERRPFLSLCVKVVDALWVMTREDAESGRLDWSETACAFGRFVETNDGLKVSMTRLARAMGMSERSQGTLKRLGRVMKFLQGIGMMWHIQGKRYEARRLFTLPDDWNRELPGARGSRAGEWATLVWDIELFELTHSRDKNVGGERKKTAFFKHESWLMSLRGKTYCVARTCVALRSLMRKQERKAGAHWIGLKRLAQEAGIVSSNRQGWSREREEVIKALEAMKAAGVLESWAMVDGRVKLVWKSATRSSVRKAQRDVLVCGRAGNATSSSGADKMGLTKPEEDGKERLLGDPHRSSGKLKARRGRRLPPKSDLLPRSKRRKRRK